MGYRDVAHFSAWACGLLIAGCVCAIGGSRKADRHDEQPDEDDDEERVKMDPDSREDGEGEGGVSTRSEDGTVEYPKYPTEGPIGPGDEASAEDVDIELGGAPAVEVKQIGLKEKKKQMTLNPELTGGRRGMSKAYKGTKHGKDFNDNKMQQKFTGRKRDPS